MRTSERELYEQAVEQRFELLQGMIEDALDLAESALSEEDTPAIKKALERALQCAEWNTVNSTLVSMYEANEE